LEVGTEFRENSEFVLDETVSETAQLWSRGAPGGDNHEHHPVDDSGGASGSVQATGDVVGSIQQGSEALSDIVHGQATDTENSVSQGAEPDQDLSDDAMDVDHDDGLVRFRSLNDVYQDSVEVDLASDT